VTVPVEGGSIILTFDPDGDGLVADDSLLLPFIFLVMLNDFYLCLI